MSKRWYLATLVMTSYQEDQALRPSVWEEQIRLIRAENHEQAYEKAIQLGQSEEQSYLNMYEKTVTWKFIGLKNVEELEYERLRDGQELRSRFFEYVDPHSLVSPKERLSVYLSNAPKEEVTKSKLLNEKQAISE